MKLINGIEFIVRIIYFHIFSHVIDYVKKMVNVYVFRGYDCSVRFCPDYCGGKGICKYENCSYKEGFIGVDCSEEICPGKSIY